VGSYSNSHPLEQIRIHFFLDGPRSVWYYINMSDKKLEIPRAKMSAEERRLRSELAKLISQYGIIRGSLLRRQRVCGKPNCKCARGEKHESLYLVVSEGGKARQLYIPKEWEQTVQQWVGSHRTARELMEGISRIYWKKVRHRQD
jgi:hypothetical protein